MVDAMLDYILDVRRFLLNQYLNVNIQMLTRRMQQTDATCAIVSDRDIAMLSSVSPCSRTMYCTYSNMARFRTRQQQGQRDIPENLSQHLANTRPDLTVTGGGACLVFAHSGIP